MSKQFQHFVPQYYFRYFSNGDKRICGLNINTGETFYGATKRQAGKNLFYGNKQNEKVLMYLDTELCSQIRTIINNRALPCIPFDETSYTKYQNILLALILQFTRTETSFLKANEAVAQMANLYTESAYNDFLKEELHIEYEKFGSIFKTMAQKLYATKLFLDGIEFALKTWISISDLMYVLLENKTKFPFIFSDHPVVLHNPIYTNCGQNGNTGLQSPGLQLYYPLNRELAIIGFDPAIYRFKHLSSLGEVKRNSDINRLNALQLHNCYKCVYSGYENDKEYLYRLYRSNYSARVKNYQAKQTIFSNTVSRSRIIINQGAAINKTVHLSFFKKENERILQSARNCPVRRKDIYDKIEEIKKGKKRSANN